MPSDPGVDPCAGEMPMPPRLLSGARASAMSRSHASQKRSTCNATPHRLRALRAAPAVPGVAVVPPAAASCSRASSCASLALTWPRGVPVVVVCGGRRTMPRQRARVRRAPRATRATWLQCLHRIVTTFCAAPPAARLALHERTRTLRRGGAWRAQPLTSQRTRRRAPRRACRCHRAAAQRRKSRTSSAAGQRCVSRVHSRNTRAAHAPAPAARSALRPPPRGCALP